MKRLLILCEGQTEETFINRVLMPHLVEHGVGAQTTMIATSKSGGTRSHRGGHAHRFDLIYSDIRKLLLSRPDAVTTMLDYYGFPENMPGFPPAKPGSTKEKLERLCEAFSKAIGDPRFIPGVLAHEFEGLLFTSPSDIVQGVIHDAAAQQTALEALNRIIIAFPGGPEDINDGKETAPSKRILDAVPGYKKVRHGPVIAQKIGLEAIRQKCPLFSSWLARLEALGQPPGATP